MIGKHRTPWNLLEFKLWRDTVSLWSFQYPYSHLENLRLYAAQKDVMQEMKELKAAGGATVVENTTAGIKRDLDFLRQVQKEVSLS